LLVLNAPGAHSVLAHAVCPMNLCPHSVSVRNPAVSALKHSNPHTATSWKKPGDGHLPSGMNIRYRSALQKSPLSKHSLSHLRDCPTPALWYEYKISLSSSEESFVQTLAQPLRYGLLSLAPHGEHLHVRDQGSDRLFVVNVHPVVAAGAPRQSSESVADSAGCTCPCVCVSACVCACVRVCVSRYWRGGGA